jgi:hypothetical protein
MSGPSDTRHTEAVIFDPLGALSHYRPDFQPKTSELIKPRDAIPITIVANQLKVRDRREMVNLPMTNGFVAIEERQRGAR